MQSFKDVWDRALVILEQELNHISFESWIKLLIPMKMENDVVAPRAGTITQVSVPKGATVNTGDTLVVLS